MPKLPSVGPGTIKRLFEILETGTLEEISNMTKVDKNDKNNKTKIMKELMMVPGIGPAKAGQLVNDHGITSLEDLINKHEKELVMLPKNVSGALEYAHELQERIPREEVELISQLVEDASNRIKLKVKMITCGSYRRGKTNSGDADILVYHNDDSYPEDTLTKLVDKLKSEKFLIGTLSEGNTKYMGICRLLDDLPARRIDIVYLTKKSLPAALMYFTGSGNFNIEFRKLALKKNLTLNEKGLYKIDKPKTKKILGQVEVKTEKDIFEEVGVQYLEPKDREPENIVLL
jgi:DNA polymerase/3'-5' exonuclease PolX